MEPVAVPSSICPPRGFDSRSVIVSVSSYAASNSTGTYIVFVRSRLPNTSVPDFGS